MAKSQIDAANHYDALSRWGKRLDEANRQRVEQTLALIVPDVRTVLDLGCGDGTVSNPLTSKGLSVTGVDISAKALQYLEGKGVLGSLDGLPFPRLFFDMVICAEVLEHLPIEVYEKALQEIERVAGGYIIVTTPNEEHLPASFVKCEHCGFVFHADLHVRTFDRALHRTLFQEFELTKTVEINTWKHQPFITLLEQHLLGIHKFKDSLICPCCSYKNVQRPKYGLLRKGILKCLRLIGRAVYRQPKARWIASLYRRTEVEGCGK